MNELGRGICDADPVSDHNLRMLPTRDTLHPTVECLEFGEGEPNAGESFGTTEWERGQRIGVSAIAGGYERGKWDDGGHEEGRVLVQEFMGEPVMVVPIEDTG